MQKEKSYFVAHFGSSLQVTWNKHAAIFKAKPQERGSNATAVAMCGAGDSLFPPCYFPDGIVDMRRFAKIDALPLVRSPTSS